MGGLIQLRSPGWLASLAGTLVCLAGGAASLGWVWDIDALTRPVGGWPRVAFTTAIAFALFGLSLAMSARQLARESNQSDSRPAQGVARLIAPGLAVAAAIIGLLRLIEIATGADLGIDRYSAIGDVGPLQGGVTAEMSPAASLSFLLLGTATVLATRLRWIGVSQGLAIATLLIAWISLGRYLYGGEPLIAYAQLALFSATLLLVAAVGVLSLHLDRGLPGLLVSESAGGTLIRRLMLPAIAIQFVVGWLRLKGQEAGWYGTEAGSLLFATANVMIFGGLIWINAALLHRSDVARQAADRKTEAQLERLNLLRQITRAVGERQDLQSIFQVVIASVEQQLPADFSCVCLLESADSSLVVSSVGSRSEALAMSLALPARARIEIDANGLSRCVSGQLVYEPDIGGASQPFPARLARAGLRAMVLAPLLVESEVLGILIAARKDPRSFSSGECEFLRQLSEHVGLAAHQAQLNALLQRAYDELRETQQSALQHERLRALGQMASGIAHNINNAIAPVSLYTESLLETEQGLSERAREYLTTVQRSIDDVIHTVATLREFYRQREPDLRPSPVDLNSLVGQAVDLTRARWSDMAQRQGVVIEIEQRTATGLPAIVGNAVELREALINLIFNAVDAMPAGGKITIATRMVEPPPRAPAAAMRQVVLEVADTGVGMDEATRARCLEPFFTTKGERGTGLGLATVYGVARRHGAELAIESTLGAGTAVRLEFPLSVTVIAGAAAEAKAAAIPPRLRILIIDDDPVLLKSLHDALRIDGHEIVSANGGQAGVEKFHAAQGTGDKFAVVITDLGMPRLDGRGVAAAIKKVSPTTPVILLTGWGMQYAANGEAPAQVDRILSKPPKLLELRRALSDCFGKSRS